MKFNLNLAELKAKLSILREHFTLEYRLQRRFDQLDGKLDLLLESLVDIHNIKPAKGRSRLRQEIGLQILRIVRDIANKHSLKYWLDFGTLLGAVRHQGFVPWDDDVDIAMERSDYVKMCDVLKSGCLPAPLVFSDLAIPDFDMDPIIHIYEPESKCFVDIFPYDRVEKALLSSGEITKWEEEYQKVFERIACERLLSARNIDCLVKSGNDWKREHRSGDGDLEGIAVGLEYLGANRIYRNVFNVNMLFPLKLVMFEGLEFLAPCCYDEYLRKIYGDFLRFPSDAGWSKHGQFDCDHLTDQRLQIVLRKLESVHISG